MPDRESQERVPEADRGSGSDAREDRPAERDPDAGEDLAPEDLPGEPGAEGGSRSPAADAPPGWPAGDDSPLGDTDQHSTG